MQSMLNPISAVTHPDPYPYYAGLVAERPLYRDDSLGLWVASSAEAVGAVLNSPACRVRPVSEPVPAALSGTAAGDIFQHLVRMNDGQRHCPFKQAVVASLAALDQPRVAQQSAHWAAHLCAEFAECDAATRVAEVSFQLPAYVVASLLGLDARRLPQLAAWVGAFVRCIAPGASPEQIAQGAIAAANLQDTFRPLLLAPVEGRAGLLAVLAREARRVGRDADDVILANGIGFLSQAYEATAGLIGNTLCALGRRDELPAQVTAEPDRLPAVIGEVLRFDPPIQNTRRFVVADGEVAGQLMEAGDAILVVLAAANRDPAANPDPDRFDWTRSNARCFTFGAGSHTCPGQQLAATIAQAGVRHLLASGCDPQALTGTVRYRPSVNARLPLFS